MSNASWKTDPWRYLNSSILIVHAWNKSDLHQVWPPTWNICLFPSPTPSPAACPSVLTMHITLHPLPLQELPTLCLPFHKTIHAHSKMYKTNSSRLSSRTIPSVLIPTSRLVLYESACFMKVHTHINKSNCRTISRGSFYYRCFTEEPLWVEWFLRIPHWFLLPKTKLGLQRAAGPLSQLLGCCQLHSSAAQHSPLAQGSSWCQWFCSGFGQ